MPLKGHISVVPRLAMGVAQFAPINLNRLRRVGAARLRAAKSSTAVTCSRVTSNCSMISSMLKAILQVFKDVATGRRVPRKTHAPLTFPGTLSTAAHFVQSSAMRLLNSVLAESLGSLRTHVNKTGIPRVAVNRILELFGGMRVR
jgi:hypothetical protein